MNLKYMTEEAVTNLSLNMMTNYDLYHSSEEWLDDYLQSVLEDKTWCIESSIPYIPVKLDTGDGSKFESKFDAANAKKIYESLKHLTPVQATDSRIWTYLTHTIYFDYMKVRWMKEDGTAEGTMKRFFVNNNQGVIRNGISRLWWYGYLTYDPSREDPYELTDLLLLNQDMAQGLLERKLGNNREWLIMILGCIQKYRNDYPDIIKSEVIQKIMKQINYEGGVTLLDVLSSQELEALFLKILERLNLTKTESQILNT